MNRFNEMINHLDKILAYVEDSDSSAVESDMNDLLYEYLQVAISFADTDEKHLTFEEISEHRSLYYEQIQKLGYDLTDFKQPIFNVNGNSTPGMMLQLKQDLIYACRKQVDSDFQMFVIEEEDEIPRLPAFELQVIEDMYELAPRDLYNYLVGTPYESLLDTEDEALEGNNNLVIMKYYQHSSEWCEYVEFDSRILNLIDVQINQ